MLNIGFQSWYITLLLLLLLLTTINKLEYKFTIYYHISLLSLLLFLSLYHFYYYHHFSLTEFIPSSIISMTPYGNNGLYLGKTITGLK